MERTPILIVEDDELVRSFLSRALTTVSADISACASGTEAMNALARRRFAVILLDGLLPDGHGVDLARRILQHHNGGAAAICFISGTLRRSQPLRSGISALPKPLRVRELTDAVEVALAWQAGSNAPLPERLLALDALSAELLVV